jgi:hypothetical protein
MGKFYPVSVPEPLSQNQHRRRSRQYSFQLSSSLGTGGHSGETTVMHSSPVSSGILKEHGKVASQENIKPDKSLDGIR